MSDAWKSYANAPPSGTVICQFEDIADGETLCLELDGFPVLLLRLGQSVRAYVNACPHQYLPLNYRGDKLISADRTMIRCTNHSAGFCSLTGVGVEGLGIEHCLDSIPITLGDDRRIQVG